MDCIYIFLKKIHVAFIITLKMKANAQSHCLTLAPQ